MSICTEVRGGTLSLEEPEVGANRLYCSAPGVPGGDEEGAIPSSHLPEYLMHLQAQQPAS